MQVMLKALAFLVVSVVTWQIMDAVRPLVAKAKPPVAQVVGQPGRLGIGPVEHHKPTAKQLANNIATVEVRRFTLVPDGDRVILLGFGCVEGRATPDRRYVWGVNVLAPNDLLLSHDIFSDQIFRMDAPGRLEQTFAERMETPPPGSRIELVLYRVGANVDVNALRDATVAQGRLVAKATRHVE